MAARQTRTTADHVRLVFITDLEGTLEPCGCTRRSAGGLDRVASLLAALRADGVATFVFVAGRMFRAPSSEGETPGARAQVALKNQAVVAVLTKLKIAAVIPSKQDLIDSQAALRELAHAKIPILTANSEVLDFEGAMPFAVFSAGRARFLASAEADDGALQRRKDEKIFWVGFASRDANTAPPQEIDLMVKLGSNHEVVVTKESRGVKLEGGGRGEVLNVVEALLPGTPVDRIEMVTHVTPETRPRANASAAVLSIRSLPVSQDIAQDLAIRNLLDQVFKQVSDPRLFTTSREPTDPTAQTYVGSDTCAACHTAAYHTWRDTKHGHAYLTLVRRHRELDLECLPCHVTGYGEAGGANVGTLSHLVGVGCESCHGPGAKHVADPQPPFRDVRKDVPERVCVRCHDAAHSDAFSYLDALGKLDAQAHPVKPRAGQKTSYAPK